MPFRRRRPRRTTLIALIALLGLLFQQLAMAAYVCPGLQGAALQPAASAMPPCHQQPEITDANRCISHCHPQPPSPDHSPSPSIPDAMLPATTWLRVVDRATIDRRDHVTAEITARAAAPPLNIRLCTFQI